MTAKARRALEKGRAMSEARVLAAARTHSAMSAAFEVVDKRYHDGQLVHNVIKDKRTFNANAGYPTSTSEYVTRVVWATECGRVLAVGSPKFTATRKAPTCIACIVPKVTYVTTQPWQRFRGVRLQ